MLIASTLALVAGLGPGHSVTAQACNPPNFESDRLREPADRQSRQRVGCHRRGDATIQGFATDISVNQGQTVSFKIDTPATPIRLDIYRMGYYAGMGARKVATVTRDRPQTSPTA